MVDFKNKVYLAPMAGVSEPVYRKLCREFGADIVVTEMVSSEGLLHNSQKTLDIGMIGEDERPVGVQLFGSDPEKLAQSVKIIEDKSNPDFIDLNCGCPVPKVVKKNGGSSLLRDPKLFGEILEAMVKAASIPITVKIRSGWVVDDWVDVELAKIAESVGVSAIAIHPRSRSMGYTGNAFWDRIKAVKEAVSDIVVVGNGDITTAQDAKRMFEETGCDSIMLARATYGNPWIFKQIKQILAGEPVEEISLAEKMKTAYHHYSLYEEAYDEVKALKEMKKNLAWYFKGFPRAAELRNETFRSETRKELLSVIDQAMELVS